MPSPFVTVLSSGSGPPWSSESGHGPTAPGAAESTRPPHESGLFLRIKERCLLPDHRVTSISGASFEGFYYAHVEFDPPAVDGEGHSQPDVPHPPSGQQPGSTLRANRSRTQHLSSNTHTNATANDRSSFPFALPTSTRSRLPVEPPGLARPSAPAQLSPPLATSIELGRAKLSGFYFHVVSARGRSLAELSNADLTLLVISGRKTRSPSRSSRSGMLRRTTGRPSNSANLNDAPTSAAHARPIILTPFILPRCSRPNARHL